MNIKWTNNVTEQEFVNYFNPEELDVIQSACEMFAGFNILCSHDVSIYIQIGRACTFKYLFTNPSSTVTVNTYNLVPQLMSLINDYKDVVSDMYYDTIDCDGYDAANVWYNAMQCCKDMLTQLIYI